MNKYIFVDFTPHVLVFLQGSSVRANQDWGARGVTFVIFKLKENPHWMFLAVFKAARLSVVQNNNTCR